MLDPDFQQLALQLHVFSTLFMTGVIWFMQVIYYPSFRILDTDRISQATQLYRQRAAWVIMPVMLVEMSTGILLMSSSWVTQYGKSLVANLAILFLIWGITLVKMSPLHSRLSSEMEEGTIQSLISTNGLRTVLWTARSILLLSFLG